MMPPWRGKIQYKPKISLILGRIRHRCRVPQGKSGNYVIFSFTLFLGPLAPFNSVNCAWHRLLLCALTYMCKCAHKHHHLTGRTRTIVGTILIVHFYPPLTGLTFMPCKIHFRTHLQQFVKIVLFLIVKNILLPILDMVVLPIIENHFSLYTSSSV